MALTAAGIGERGRPVVAELQRESLLRATSIEEDAGVETYHDRLREVVLGAIPADLRRVRHLAIIELFLEAARRPELHATMSALRTSQIQLMRDIHSAAGLELVTADAALLVTAITGIVHFALTTPEAIGIRSPDEVRPLVRRAVDLIHARVARHVA